MIKQLVIDYLDGTPTVCLMEDGELVEYHSSGRDNLQLVGNIYLGRIQNLLPALGSAFIDIGLGKNAIISLDELKDKDGRLKFHAGEEILVQVTKLPGGEKGVVVSSDIKLAGRVCVLMPLTDGIGVSKRIGDEGEEKRLRELAARLKPEGMGLIVRTNAAGEDESEIVSDIKKLLNEWQSVSLRAKHIIAPALLKDDSDILYRAARDIFCDDIKEVAFSNEMLYNTFLEYLKAFAPSLTDRVKLVKTDNLFAIYKIESQIKRSKQRKVYLDCGGYIVIDPTEAMTVIDVNSGKCSTGADARKTILKVNLEAAREIARQIRLRDMGGIIITDYIDMSDRADRNLLLNELKGYTSGDKRTSVIDITPLGLVEMTRKKKTRA